MDIDLVFPTAIGKESNFLNKEEKNKLEENISRIKNDIPNSENNWLSGDNSPYNTISSYNFVDDDEFSFFINRVTQSIYDYSSAYEDQDTLIASNAWVNIYSNSNFQEPHTHPGCRYSAVYFLKAPSGSGQLIFQNPSLDQMITTNTTNSNFLVTSSLGVIPEENSLIVFKSNLQHYVLPGTNDEDRISIAINYMPEPKIRAVNDKSS